MKIVEAVYDENRKYKGGKAGDQTGKEVRVCDWRNFNYTHVFRWKNKTLARLFVTILVYWANNKHIGYDQGKNDRNDLWDYLAKKKWKSYIVDEDLETVCSNLVECALKFCGVDIPRNTLSGKLLKLLKKMTSKFECLTATKYRTSGDYLMMGDILIKDGHVAVAIENGSKVEVKKVTTKKIYLDAGHGGKDSGAVAAGYYEKHITLDIMMACKDYLKNTYKDIEVKCSRETDKYRNLNNICNEINTWGADVAVSIHINAGGGDGCEALVSKGSTKATALAKDILLEVEKLGQNAHGTLIKTRLNSSGSDYFAFNRIPKCPSPIIEYFFIDNLTDRKIGDTLSERKKLGQATAKGIAEYLGLKKKTTTTPKKELKVGAKVKIKANATDLNTKKKFSEFVYGSTYTVISITASRVVFGVNGKVTGVVHKDNITLV